nr:MAG TPA: hypothetical protein [Caudoviricetes sp.]
MISFCHYQITNLASAGFFLAYAHFAFIPGKGDNYLVSLDN